MNDLTAAWVQAARTVCSIDDGHRSACRSAQGKLRRVSEERWSKIVKPGLRWPGYLGARYEAGGLLSIGIVHTDFSTAGLREAAEVSTALQAHQAWADGRLDDQSWLAALRVMYRSGLSWPGGWSVAKHHSFYWKALGESVDEIAYVNAMRCQWPGSGPGDGVVGECVRALSLHGLVGILRPRLVISNSRPAFDELLGTVPVIYVHQLYGRNLEAVRVDDVRGSLIGIGNREETVEQLRATGFSRAQH